jgi:hexosaminidase
MKHIITSIILAVMTTIANADTLNVVPAVQQWTPSGGTMKPGAVEEKILTGTAPAGWYTIDIGEKVVISAQDSTGIFYGHQTLKQLLQQSPNLPKGKIVDWPAYKHRMLMLDVGRKPFPLPVLQDYLRIMAWYKMNELHLHFSDEAFGGHYTGFRIQCDTFPGLASKDLHYTKKELRELQDQARAMGITITPEIDMPGHSRCFTDYWPDIMLKDHPNYMDVTNPKTIERMKQLLDEMIPIFDAPDFHIGTDEYIVEATKEEKERLHEAFRQFINTMNAHVRSKGKNTRIWTGFEHMKGTTQIDPTVIIDMWDTDDAKSLLAKGHKVINSNSSRTYIVPGCHYFGVSNSGLYNSWEPWMFSRDNTKNPTKDEPNLLGGKLHVWNDQGPTGYTLTEIANLSLPSIQAIAEKLWGTKGSKDYTQFQKRAALTLPIAGVTIFDRMPEAKNKIVFRLAGTRQLTTTNAVIPLMKGRANLEYPWTLTMDICKTADTGKRGVILSSDLVEICSDYTHTDEIKKKDAAGKEIKEEIKRTGIGLIRAAGSRNGADPASTHLTKDVSRVYSEPLPLNKWMTVTIVGNARNTTVYINGAKTGSSNNQMVCPLERLGSATGNSFVGKIRNLKVYNRAFTAKEIGRAAGLDIPDNLAAKKTATASRTDESYGHIPEHLTDGDGSTRWSSGQDKTETWVAIDLGQPATFNTVTVSWGDALAKKLRVELSDDNQNWREVARVEVTSSSTTANVPRQKARHVRLVMNEPATGRGFSILEVEVLNKKNQ